MFDLRENVTCNSRIIYYLSALYMISFVLRTMFFFLYLRIFVEFCWGLWNLNSRILYIYISIVHGLLCFDFIFNLLMLFYILVVWNAHILGSNILMRSLCDLGVILWNSTSFLWIYIWLRVIMVCMKLLYLLFIKICFVYKHNTPFVPAN